MEFDILDSLEELGYPHLTTEDSAKTVIREGLKSLEFYNLVAWLSKELQELCQLESCINTVSGLEDESSFLVEVSTFLKELECPYYCLTNGTIAEILKEEKNRTVFLDYLCHELFCARIAVTKMLKEKQALDIEMDSSPSATCLSSILKILNIDVVSTNDGSELLEAVISKLEEKIAENPEIIKEPLLKEELSEIQWKKFEALYSNLRDDYEVRREVLLTRLDVVAQSFKWGDNIKSKEDQITKIFQPRRKEMKPCPDVELADILTATKELTIIEKASCASVRKNTVSELNRVVIDRVPDRGGRPNEQRPPVEMPQWKKRTQSQDGGNFRGRGRGGYHGGGSQNKGKTFHRNPKSTNQSKDSGAFDAMGSYGSN